MVIKYESRKFIDLILSSASKWVNWDPPTSISVGDYGSINRETGEFMWEGNIYNDHFQELLDKSPEPIKIDLKDPALQPEVSVGDDKLIISSSGVYATDAKLGAEVSVQSQANVSLHVNFEFRDEGGAILVLHKPQYSSLPKDERFTSLFRAAHEALKGKSIITQVISCPAYLMVLSRQKGEKVSASLSATHTNPVATIGAEAGLKWSSEMVHGLHRSGSNTQAIFKPLYKLMQPRRTFWNFIFGQRGGDSENESIVWEDVRRPWDLLDDEGEEMERYDPTMEDDSCSDWEMGLVGGEEGKFVAKYVGADDVEQREWAVAHREARLKQFFQISHAMAG
ncbi:hypothetical protein HYDPIDRAFT_43109 [Hydnomerulius pinastri MD-312]|uniref:Unplaced genomic scaffold scaffold_35, whole genome shotgun sequence n=1 Tax=Hydnomerulius pinastri MD-312 TaxID=994086 RepID=A0A0C9WBF4_9AGAM|nr:hypothetical protein HYDPIDRAFT_43109 [Hydnomerulius pinastri MD-312]